MKSVPRFPPRLSSPGKTPTCLASLTEMFKDTEKKHTSSFDDLQEFFHQFLTMLLIFIIFLCVFVTLSRLLLWIKRREQWVSRAIACVTYMTVLS